MKMIEQMVFPPRPGAVARGHIPVGSEVLGATVGPEGAYIWFLSDMDAALTEPREFIVQPANQPLTIQLDGSNLRYIGHGFVPVTAAPGILKPSGLDLPGGLLAQQQVTFLPVLIFEIVKVDG